MNVATTGPSAKYAFGTNQLITKLRTIKVICSCNFFNKQQCKRFEEILLIDFLYALEFSIWYIDNYPFS
jgi:hypothetical protein